MEMETGKMPRKVDIKARRLDEITQEQSNDKWVKSIKILFPTPRSR